MGYRKQNFFKGQPFTASNLNYIEDGIVDLERKINNSMNIKSIYKWQDFVKDGFWDEALKQALKNLEENDILYFPNDNVYSFYSLVTIDKKIKLVGENSTLKVAGITIESPCAIEDMIITSQVEIDNSYGVLITASNVALKNLIVENFNGNGIEIANDSNQNNFENISLIGNKGNGVCNLGSENSFFNIYCRNNEKNGLVDVGEGFNQYINLKSTNNKGVGLFIKGSQSSFIQNLECNSNLQEAIVFAGCNGLILNNCFFNNNGLDLKEEGEILLYKTSFLEGNMIFGISKNFHHLFLVDDCSNIEIKYGYNADHLLIEDEKFVNEHLKETYSIKENSQNISIRKFGEGGL